MLFLFVEHAFDVGDLLEVEMVSYRVKKIDLMYTVSTAAHTPVQCMHHQAALGFPCGLHLESACSPE